MALFRDTDALTPQVSRQISNKLQLLFRSQTANDGLQDASNSNVVLANETTIIDICEYAHEKLAVHSISHSTMSRNAVAEILDIERALEA